MTLNCISGLKISLVNRAAFIIFSETSQLDLTFTKVYAFNLSEINFCKESCQNSLHLHILILISVEDPDPGFMAPKLVFFFSLQLLQKLQ